jgi:hypothetical protein
MIQEKIDDPRAIDPGSVTVGQASDSHLRSSAAMPIASAVR